jgi:hypothetical protein
LIVKTVILGFGALVLAGMFIPTEASAIVCARGVVRAGCAGPNGAVVARRPAPAAVVVPARRGCTIVAGRRVCR